MLRRLYGWCVRAGTSSPSLCLVHGALAAVCLATLCQQVATLWGTSLPVSTAIAAALALGLAAGVARREVDSAASGIAGALWQLALLAFIVCAPWCVHMADALVARPGVLEPADGIRNGLIVTAICLVLIGIPAAICARSLTRYAPASTSSREAGWLMIGVAIGLSLWGFGLAQIVGPWYCGVAAVAAGLALAIWQFVQQAEASAAEARSTMPGSTPTLSVRDYVSSGTRAWRSVCDGALALGCGGLLAASSRVLEQLLPGTIYLVCAEVIGLLAGLGIGALLVRSRLGRSIPVEQRRLMACLALATGGALLPVAFPLFIQAGLWLNATVASTSLLLIARGLTAAFVTLPVGLMIAACVAGDGSSASEATPAKIRLWILCGTIGFCLVGASGAWEIGAEQALVMLAWGVIAAAILHSGLRGAIPSGRLGRGALAAGLLLLAAAPYGSARYDVRRSSRLLFNTNVFVGYRMGYTPEILPVLDEGRHVATIHGARGTSTVWKYGGRQLQLRENGMPAGVVSCDSRVFPRFLPETLQAALPMILHKKPQSLLLLGLGSSESLFTGLSFPVPEIACWEGNANRVQVIRDVVADHTGVDPLADDRVRLTIADPALALDAEPGQFDAIVSSPEHVALLRAQPCFTQSFYRRVARRLTPSGVFCQRVQFIDLGPRPLQTIVRTMQSVFPDVLAIEVAPGELLLAATNDPEGLLRAKLTDRLQLPHMRFLLAESGIDWTVLLNLTAWHNEGLAEFAAGDARRPNIAENSRLSFSLPREVMRWGTKLQEVQTAMRPHAGRLLAWIGEEGASPPLLRRLAEVAGQQTLMARYSEQYWSYRATLRTHLTEKSRSKIQQASATTEPKAMHPEDRRRLKYFAALGRATKTRSRADIEFLERFEFPYDPLVSYFVHLEAAELYAQSDERDPGEELRHRLHAIWYSSARDASLRNVAAALHLLRETPEAEPDAVTRWDLLNALLQALQQRWEARAGITPNKVEDVINDIDLTVRTAEETFEMMVAATRDAGLPPELWTARRAALERTLLRPVKAYRSEMLPHLHRNAARAHAASPTKIGLEEENSEDDTTTAAHFEQPADEQTAEKQTPEEQPPAAEAASDDASETEPAFSEPAPHEETESDP